MKFIKNTTISINKNVYIKLKRYISAKVGLSAKEFTEKAILKLIKEEEELESIESNPEQETFSGNSCKNKKG